MPKSKRENAAKAAALVQSFEKLWKDRDGLKKRDVFWQPIFASQLRGALADLKQVETQGYEHVRNRPAVRAQEAKAVNYLKETQGRRQDYDWVLENLVKPFAKKHPELQTAINENEYLLASVWREETPEQVQIKRKFLSVNSEPEFIAFLKDRALVLQQLENAKAMYDRVDGMLGNVDEKLQARQLKAVAKNYLRVYGAVSPLLTSVPQNYQSLARLAESQFVSDEKALAVFLRNRKEGLQRLDQEQFTYRTLVESKNFADKKQQAAALKTAAQRFDTVYQEVVQKLGAVPQKYQSLARSSKSLAEFWQLVADGKSTGSDQERTAFLLKKKYLFTMESCLSAEIRQSKPELVAKFRASVEKLWDFTFRASKEVKTKSVAHVITMQAMKQISNFDSFLLSNISLLMKCFFDQTSSGQKSNTDYLSYVTFVAAFLTYLLSHYHYHDHFHSSGEDLNKKASVIPGHISAETFQELINGCGSEEKAMVRLIEVVENLEKRFGSTLEIGRALMHGALGFGVMKLDSGVTTPIISCLSSMFGSLMSALSITELAAKIPWWVSAFFTFVIGGGFGTMARSMVSSEVYGAIGRAETNPLGRKLLVENIPDAKEFAQVLHAPKMGPTK